MSKELKAWAEQLLSSQKMYSFTETVSRWQELRCFSIRIYRLWSSVEWIVLTSFCCVVVWLGAVVHFLFYFEGTTQHLSPFAFFLFSPPLALIIGFTRLLFYLPASQSCQCFQPPAQLFLALSYLALAILFCDKFASLDYFLIISCSPAAVVFIF